LYEDDIAPSHRTGLRGPIEFFATARKHQILLAVLDHLKGVAMHDWRSRRPTRSNSDALDLKPCGQRRRGRRGHGLRTAKARFFRSFSARNIRRSDDRARRRPPEPMMIPVRSCENFGGCQAGVQNRLIHRDMVPACAAGMKTHGAAIDDFAGSSVGAP